MMKQKSLAGSILIFFSAIGLIALGGCKLPTSGILYSLENEVPIDNIQHGIAKNCSSNQQTTFADCYVLLVGTAVYATKIPSATSNGVSDPVGTWVPLPLPDGSTPVFTTLSNKATMSCIALAGDANKLYAIYLSNTGSSAKAKLYSTTFDSTNAGSATWTEIDLSATLPYQSPQGLFSISGAPVLLQTQAEAGSSAAGSVYQLHRLDASGSITTLAAATANLRPFIAADGPATATMFATANKLYMSNLLAGAPVLSDVAPPAQPADKFSAIAWNQNAAAPVYYLASSSGYLVSYDAGTWTGPATVQTLSGSTTAEAFSGLIHLNSSFLDRAGKTSIVPGAVLLAATVGQGLVLVDPSTMTIIQQPAVRDGDLLWGGNYSSTDLSSVSHFFRGANSTIFIGTYAKGLWSCQFNSAYATSGSTGTKNGLIFTWE